jgi:hypothetical protein
MDIQELPSTIGLQKGHFTISYDFPLQHCFLDEEIITFMVFQTKNDDVK